MTVDTACGRPIHGSEWRRRYQESLKTHGLEVLGVEASDPFRFGISGCRSTRYNALPTAIGQVPLIVLGSEIEENPNLTLLGSLALMQALGLIMDTFNHKAFFTKIGVETEL